MLGHHSGHSFFVNHLLPRLPSRAKPTNNPGVLLLLVFLFVWSVFWSVSSMHLEIREPRSLVPSLVHTPVLIEIKTRLGVLRIPAGLFLGARQEFGDVSQP